MRFYTKQHKYYCGIDLHARTMFICILDQGGEVLFHRNKKATQEAFLKVIEPYREDIVVAVECIFMWYWLADLCAEENIAFVLGHALYMKAIHGGKSKNDRIDPKKIAILLRGGTLPVSYVYPRKMRSTRDLLRRRNYLKRKRAELLTHIHNTNSQYNLPALPKGITSKVNREGVAEHFPDPSASKSIEIDLQLLDFYDGLLRNLELYILRAARDHNSEVLDLLQTIPGVGKILAFVLLYEIHEINRFARVQDFGSYCRLVKCPRESAGKRQGSTNKKIGNVHLKWAFSEAAVGLLRESQQTKSYHMRLESKHGKGKALSILAHKLGRAVYFMLKRREAFDIEIFFSTA